MHSLNNGFLFRAKFLKHRLLEVGGGATIFNWRAGSEKKSLWRARSSIQIRMDNLLLDTNLVGSLIFK